MFPLPLSQVAATPAPGPGSVAGSPLAVAVPASPALLALHPVLASATVSASAPGGAAADDIPSASTSANTDTDSGSKLLDVAFCARLRGPLPAEARLLQLRALAFSGRAESVVAALAHAEAEAAAAHASTGAAAAAGGAADTLSDGELFSVLAGLVASRQAETAVALLLRDSAARLAALKARTAHGTDAGAGAGAGVRFAVTARLMRLLGTKQLHALLLRLYQATLAMGVLPSPAMADALAAQATRLRALPDVMLPLAAPHGHGHGAGHSAGSAAERGATVAGAAGAVLSVLVHLNRLMDHLEHPRPRARLLTMEGGDGADSAPAEAPMIDADPTLAAYSPVALTTTTTSSASASASASAEATYMAFPYPAAPAWTASGAAPAGSGSASAAPPPPPTQATVAALRARAARPRLLDDTDATSSSSSSSSSGGSGIPVAAAVEPEPRARAQQQQHTSGGGGSREGRHVLSGGPLAGASVAQPALLPVAAQPPTVAAAAPLLSNAAAAALIAAAAAATAPGALATANNSSYNNYYNSKAGASAGAGSSSLPDPLEAAFATVERARVPLTTPLLWAVLEAALRHGGAGHALAVFTALRAAAARAHARAVSDAARAEAWAAVRARSAVAEAEAARAEAERAVAAQAAAAAEAAARDAESEAEAAAAAVAAAERRSGEEDDSVSGPSLVGARPQSRSAAKSGSVSDVETDAEAEAALLRFQTAARSAAASPAANYGSAASELEHAADGESPQSLQAQSQQAHQQQSPLAAHDAAAPGELPLQLWLSLLQRLTALGDATRLSALTAQLRASAHGRRLPALVAQAELRLAALQGDAPAAARVLVAHLQAALQPVTATATASAQDVARPAQLSDFVALLGLLVSNSNNLFVPSNNNNSSSSSVAADSLSDANVSAGSEPQSLIAALTESYAHFFGSSNATAAAGPGAAGSDSALAGSGRRYGNAPRLARSALWADLAVAAAAASGPAGAGAVQSPQQQGEWVRSVLAAVAAALPPPPRVALPPSHAAAAQALLVDAAPFLPASALWDKSDSGSKRLGGSDDCELLPVPADGNAASAGSADGGGDADGAVVRAPIVLESLESLQLNHFTDFFGSAAPVLVLTVAEFLVSCAGRRAAAALSAAEQLARSGIVFAPAVLSEALRGHSLAGTMRAPVAALALRSHSRSRKSPVTVAEAGDAAPAVARAGEAEVPVLFVYMRLLYLAAYTQAFPAGALPHWGRLRMFAPHAPAAAAAAVAASGAAPRGLFHGLDAFIDVPVVPNSNTDPGTAAAVSVVDESAPVPVPPPRALLPRAALDMKWAGHLQAPAAAAAAVGCYPMQPPLSASADCGGDGSGDSLPRFVSALLPPLYASPAAVPALAAALFPQALRLNARVLHLSPAAAAAPAPAPAYLPLSPAELVAAQAAEAAAAADSASQDAAAAVALVPVPASAPAAAVQTRWAEEVSKLLFVSLRPLLADAWAAALCVPRARFPHAAPPGPVETGRRVLTLLAAHEQALRLPGSAQAAETAAAAVAAALPAAAAEAREGAGAAAAGVAALAAAAEALLGYADRHALRLSQPAYLALARAQALRSAGPALEALVTHLEQRSVVPAPALAAELLAALRTARFPSDAALPLPVPPAAALALRVFDHCKRGAVALPPPAYAALLALAARGRVRGRLWELFDDMCAALRAAHDARAAAARAALAARRAAFQAALARYVAAERAALREDRCERVARLVVGVVADVDANDAQALAHAQALLHGKLLQAVALDRLDRIAGLADSDSGVISDGNGEAARALSAPLSATDVLHVSDREAFRAVETLLAREEDRAAPAWAPPDAAVAEFVSAALFRVDGARSVPQLLDALAARGVAPSVPVCVAIARLAHASPSHAAVAPTLARVLAAMRTAALDAQARAARAETEAEFMRITRAAAVRLERARGGAVLQQTRARVAAMFEPWSSGAAQYMPPAAAGERDSFHGPHGGHDHGYRSRAAADAMDTLRGAPPLSAAPRGIAAMLAAESGAQARLHSASGRDGDDIPFEFPSSARRSGGYVPGANPLGSVGSGAGSLLAATAEARGLSAAQAAAAAGEPTSVRRVPTLWARSVPAAHGSAAATADAGPSPRSSSSSSVATVDVDLAPARQALPLAAVGAVLFHAMHSDAAALAAAPFAPENAAAAEAAAARRLAAGLDPDAAAARAEDEARRAAAAADAAARRAAGDFSATTEQAHEAEHSAERDGTEGHADLWRTAAPASLTATAAALAAFASAPTATAAAGVANANAAATASTVPDYSMHFPRAPAPPPRTSSPALRRLAAVVSAVLAHYAAQPAVAAAVDAATGALREADLAALRALPARLRRVSGAVVVRDPRDAALIGRLLLRDATCDVRAEARAAADVAAAVATHAFADAEAQAQATLSGADADTGAGADSGAARLWALGAEGPAAVTAAGGELPSLYLDGAESGNAAGVSANSAHSKGAVEVLLSFHHESERTLAVAVDGASTSGTAVATAAAVNVAVGATVTHRNPTQASLAAAAATATEAAVAAVAAATATAAAGEADSDASAAAASSPSVPRSPPASASALPPASPAGAWVPGADPRALLDHTLTRLANRATGTPQAALAAALSVLLDAHRYGFYPSLAAIEALLLRALALRDAHTAALLLDLLANGRRGFHAAMRLNFASAPTRAQLQQLQQLRDQSQGQPGSRAWLRHRQQLLQLQQPQAQLGYYAVPAPPPHGAAAAAAAAATANGSLDELPGNAHAASAQASANPSTGNLMRTPLTSAAAKAARAAGAGARADASAAAEAEDAAETAEAAAGAATGLATAPDSALAGYAEGARRDLAAEAKRRRELEAVARTLEAALAGTDRSRRAQRLREAAGDGAETAAIDENNTVNEDAVGGSERMPASMRELLSALTRGSSNSNSESNDNDNGDGADTATGASAGTELQLSGRRVLVDSTLVPDFWGWDGADLPRFLARLGNPALRPRPLAPRMLSRLAPAAGLPADADGHGSGGGGGDAAVSAETAAAAAAAAEAYGAELSANSDADGGSDAAAAGLLSLDSVGTAASTNPTPTAATAAALDPEALTLDLPAADAGQLSLVPLAGLYCFQPAYFEHVQWRLPRGAADRAARVAAAARANAAAAESATSAAAAAAAEVDAAHGSSRSSEGAGAEDDEEDEYYRLSPADAAAGAAEGAAEGSLLSALLRGSLVNGGASGSGAVDAAGLGGEHGPDAVAAEAAASAAADADAGATPFGSFLSSAQQQGQGHGQGQPGAAAATSLMPVVVSAARLPVPLLVALLNLFAADGRFPQHVASTYRAVAAALPAQLVGDRVHLTALAALAAVRAPAAWAAQLQRGHAPESLWLGYAAALHCAALRGEGPPLAVADVLLLQKRTAPHLLPAGASADADGANGGEVVSDAAGAAAAGWAARRCGCRSRRRPWP